MARISMPVCLGSTLLLACATATLVAARTSSPDPARQRRFMSGVELVTADFVAVDADGRPVIDLTAADVSVKVDGRSRTVRSLQFVEIAQPTAAAPKAITQPSRSPSSSSAAESPCPSIQRSATAGSAPQKLSRPTVIVR